MLTVYVAAALLVTTLFVATGCGKSSNSTADVQPATSQATTTADVANNGSASGGSSTRDSFVAEANAICKRIVAQRAVANSRVKSNQALPRQVALLATYEKGEFATLGGLRPPSSMEGEWKPMVALVKRLSAETTKFGDYLKEGRVKFGYTQVFPVVVTIESKLAAAASRAGLNDCKAI